MADGGFIAGRKQLGVRRFGTTCTVADNPRAHLMYYLNCVNTVLELNEPGLARLTRHESYWQLDADDVRSLMAMVLLFSPDKLVGKVFFINEDIDSLNTFFELQQVRL